MDITSLDLAKSSQMLHAREISALELTELYLDRIAKCNPTLNAFITLTEESALAAARRADEELARGHDRGALHGIPLGLKDLFETRGVRTTAGSKILTDHVPDEDAVVVTRLRDAGAVILGKLNMHEWAYGVTNNNPHFGRCKNPWDLERISGGSSGGSAVVVAARLAAGALGSDTGGSIRIPASLCGVTGIKPTYGRVSLRGVIPLSWSMDHAGPLAQTAEDCALLLQAIAGYDPLDPVSVDNPVPNFSALLAEPINGMRVVHPTGFFLSDLDHQVLGAVDEAMRVLEMDGARLIEKEMPFAEEMYQMNRVALPPEAVAYHRENLENRFEDFGEDVGTRLRASAATALTDYALAKRRQVELTRALELWFDNVDVLVTPTTRIPAPLATVDPKSMAQNLTAFTAPFNLTGFPAISLPCGFTHDGLPIGLQLIARPWNEALLLQIAHRYQTLTDWHTRVPDVK